MGIYFLSSSTGENGLNLQLIKFQQIESSKFVAWLFYAMKERKIWIMKQKYHKKIKIRTFLAF